MTLRRVIMISYDMLLREHLRSSSIIAMIVSIRGGVVVGDEFWQL